MECRICRKGLAGNEDSIKYGVRHYAHVRCLLRHRGEARGWDLILVRPWYLHTILAWDDRLIADHPPASPEQVVIIARHLKDYPILTEFLRRQYPVEVAMAHGEPISPFTEK